MPIKNNLIFQRILEWWYRTLIFLKIKKGFIWKPSEYELKLLENAYSKKFKPTIESIKKFSRGKDFKIELSYTDLSSVNHKNKFNTSLSIDDNPGIKFKIKLPKYLNVGGVKHKESYGLSNLLTLSNGTNTYFVPQNSVKDFETKFPFVPQFLEGRFTRLRSSIEYNSNSYFRTFLFIKDKEMIFPTSILDFGENHMKFDYPSWDRQDSLIGMPFLSTKGMYAELKIKGGIYHFYGIDQIKSLVIDSIDQITHDYFKKIAYAIRLCFAFLTGKFYRDEVVYLGSYKSDFSEISFVDYQLEESSIISDNQLINPTFFFNRLDDLKGEISDKWKESRKMFSTETFSLICEKIIDSNEFSRSLELVINAGNISDPIQKGAMYSVCIETLTDLVKNENEKLIKPIPENKVWENLRTHIRKSLDLCKDEISSYGYAILSSKIDNLNTPTNRVKLEMPFKLVGIQLTESELTILDHRNDYLHGGQPDYVEWAINSSLNALRLHALIGKLVLKYFGYTGHYINVAGWYILHNKESKRLLENLNIEYVMDILQKTKKNDLESIENMEDALLKLDEFNKILVAMSEVEDLIGII